jgi:phosphoglycolate phosphatase-like HAD superfamily hydrolase
VRAVGGRLRALAVGADEPSAVARDNRGLLLLFDIDGTLLRGAAAAHGDALHAALREVYGVADPAAIPSGPVAGRTDIEIARTLLLNAGVSAERIDAGLSRLRERCCEEYARRCPSSLTEHLIAGMPELLEELSRKPGVRLSLVTGNLEPVARLKLSRAGIGQHFPRGQGGFGSDAEDRAELPAIARRRAGRNGAPHPRDRTIVIGDTPRDIACAHADALRCRAVATGPYEASDLVGADAVAMDATELRELLEAEL